MIKPAKTKKWLNKKVRTKDDFQFVVMVLLILFVVFTKCYMIYTNKAEAKQAETISQPGMKTPFTTSLSAIK